MNTRTRKSNKAPTEHFTKMIRHTMETPAWRSLSTTAQALYPWLKLEWRGPKNNNNGSIRLSNRQAAAAMGIGIDTASRAFHDLQAKGFLVITKPARLGVGGEAKSPEYEITELALPQSERGTPRKFYQHWKDGKDFPVYKSMANNPSGNNGKKKTCPHIHDSTVISMRKTN